MPRIPRNSFETSFFHVIVQGINKEEIFKKDKYKVKYIDLLLKSKNEFNIKILAYCIMNNHAHILIYTQKITEMSKFMKKVNSIYGNYYNFMENRVGYVFRDRYVSEPIYNYNYLYKCIAYIHANPIEAKIVINYNDYRYSSYNNFINNKIDKDVLDLIFNGNEYFVDEFNYIHSKKYEFKDCIKNKMNWKEFVEKYENKTNTSISEIRKDKKALKKLILQAQQETDLSVRKIAMKLNISKTYLYNIIKIK